MKKKNIFNDLGKAATGLGSIGIISGVGSVAAVKSGVPGLTGSFTTLSSFTGIATTAYGAKSVLKMTKKLK